MFLLQWITTKLGSECRSYGGACTTWFPGCAYARQLCGHQLYQQIQRANRLPQGSVRILHFISSDLFIFYV